MSSHPPPPDSTPENEPPPGQPPPPPQYQAPIYQAPVPPPPSSPTPGFQPSPYAPGPAVYSSPTDTGAIVSLVMGIVSIVMLCACALVSPVLGGGALIVGLLARQRIARSQGALAGQGISMAGIVTGVAGGGLGVLLIVFGLATILFSLLTQRNSP
jgi:hypothetical protein